MQWARTPSTPTPIHGANAFLISGWLGERVGRFKAQAAASTGRRVCARRASLRRNLGRSQTRQAADAPATAVWARAAPACPYDDPCAARESPRNWSAATSQHRHQTAYGSPTSATGALG